MGELAESTVQLLNYLISGFLTAWIFYSLTPFKINNQFERVIQALIFTLIETFARKNTQKFVKMI